MSCEVRPCGLLMTSAPSKGAGCGCRGMEKLSLVSNQVSGSDRLQLVVQQETLFATLSVRHRQEKSDALPRRLVGACWFLFFHFLEQLFDALDMFLRKVQ